MKLTLTYSCSGCANDTEIQCRKPGALTPSMLSFRCPVCESSLTLKVSKPRVRKSNKEFLIDTLNIKVSAKLHKALAAEAP